MMVPKLYPDLFLITQPFEGSKYTTIKNLTLAVMVPKCLVSSDDNPLKDQRSKVNPCCNAKCCCSKNILLKYVSKPAQLGLVIQVQPT
jgi:hypothetical protein